MSSFRVGVNTVVLCHVIDLHVELKVIISIIDYPVVFHPWKK